MSQPIDRRHFIGAAAAAGVAHAANKPSRNSILNFNANMDYRPLGKTGLMVSAVCMGGHWKRVENNLSQPFKGVGYTKQDYENVNNPEFIKNRDLVVSKAIELGINYIDACSGPEVLAYSKVLKGRRQKMHLGFSWYEREPRFKEWRNGKKLVEGLEMSMKQAGLDYVDVWRITLPEERMPDLGELTRIEEATAEALMLAKKQGKARCTGVSTHNRVWLKTMIEEYPKQFEVVLFPYTPKSKELPAESLFGTLKKFKVGAFGIKPFASNALFQGSGKATDPNKEEDDKRARLALRYVFANPEISAPIPGIANVHQIENAARAVLERRKLDAKERAELDRASEEMWVRLQPNYQWLKNWEYV